MKKTGNNISKYHSRIHKLLLQTFFLKEKNRISRIIWNGIANYTYQKYKGPIVSKIHKFDVIINNGYTYPFTARIFRTFNNPLLELVNLTFHSKKSPINIVDVGAAIGDTTLLLCANSDEQIKKIYMGTKTTRH